MSVIFSKFRIPSGHMGKDNMLPDIHNNQYIRTSVDVSDKLSEDEKKYVGYGKISTLLPYTLQDDYDRSRDIREFDCAILENDYLKATFVTELGGRLWSLYDKKNDKELLYSNKVFQPANLALRNAWFSGGVEWNIGIRGHTPLTCSPLFAQKVHSKNGEEILKMFEYERIRGVVYSIYATLKDDVLLVKVCIENTNDHDVPMYWWSNMAIPEKASTRIIVPAKEMFYCAYEQGRYVLSKSTLPCLGGIDITYPINSNRSRDFFFKIPDDDPKWIAGIDGTGSGLLEFSTKNLKGRKLFVWGQGMGGHRWNEWLSDSKDGYVEIQAGLLRTQLEHFPMKKNSELSFIEGFTSISLSSEDTNADFYAASEKAGEIARKRINSIDENVFDISKEDDFTYMGSGWGALQNHISEKKISKYCRFPDSSITDEQKDWFELSNGKPLSCAGKESQIPSYVVGEYWEKAIESTLEGNWYEYLQLGIVKYASGDYESSRNCFEKSIQCHPNAWAYRNLAQIKGNIQGDLQAAALDMEKAADLLPDYVPLLIETCLSLMRCDEYGRWVDRYNKSPDVIKNHGRIRMLTGACYVRMDDTEKAKEFINDSTVVNDIMEGEYSLSEIWYELYARVLAKERGVKPESLEKEEVFKHYPIPYALDFRMH